MEKVKKLLLKKLPEQRTPEWYAARLKRITASEAASCLFKTEAVCKEYCEIYNVKMKYNENVGVNPYEKLEDYIIKKCQSSYSYVPFPNSDATLWGKKYEPIATRLYTIRKNTIVHEFGLVPHETLEWLAASPDGITENGIMIEIKCPMSRKIESAPPLYYYIQCQIQMETCDLDQCDFLECEIKEITEEEFYEIGSISEIDTNSQDFGIILQYPQTPQEIKTKEDFQIIYPPNELVTRKDYIKWRDSQLRQNHELIPIYYFISKWNIIEIKRSKIWFENVKDTIKSIWDKIVNFQSNKENFDNYKQSIQEIKNKQFIETFNNTICLIDSTA